MDARDSSDACAALSLFGVDVQQPSHPLRFSLCDRRRGLSRPGRTRAVVGNLAARSSVASTSRGACNALRIPRSGSVVRQCVVCCLRPARWKRRQYRAVGERCRRTARDGCHCNGCVTFMRVSADRFQDIRDGVRALCAGFADEYFRKIDEARGYPDAFVDALTKAGWLAALIPPEYGGSGLGLAEASVIMEEINRCGGNSGACHGQMYNMGTLVRHGSEAQKRKFLPRN